MAKLFTDTALGEHTRGLLIQAARTPDDFILLEAMQHNDIRHACQPIRHTESNEVTFQHLTLRFGSNNEQSVYRFDLSDEMRYALDLFGLLLAIRHIKFQQETILPSLINPLVVPLQAETLLNWEPGHQFLAALYDYHGSAMRDIVPCIQLFQPDLNQTRLNELLSWLHDASTAVWVDLRLPTPYLPLLEKTSPAAIKVAQMNEDTSFKQGLLPVIRFLRQNDIDFVAGRVATQHDLIRFRRLGAGYYFGYISDIPTSFSAPRKLKLVK
ncbi:hypothetical protein L4174_007265 [Photobacterium sp. CCB-ST2H9]|uniref:hypothetical protein n=1 Tax=Photobacterium sp. CCB-ST2H9 TaxID=2912855 RepID=UPI0020049FF2|nr:hypothetical protein [Photobacterium sp. CCB-ST2H9]UTM58625.1 hypothetical protein L4174_007265 [Photobacterium sp. CCB-ST2H9]